LPLLDRQVQDVGNGLAAKSDLKRVAVEPCSLTSRAHHLNIGHEKKLGANRTFALTLLTPAALNVEAEAPALVSALDRSRSLRKYLPDTVVESHVGCRV